jgi:phage baseplate assembly protein W
MPQSTIQVKKPIGLTIPIRNSGIGMFEQTFDTFTSIKYNIINLLKTKPGERRLQPVFGTRLYDVVFEPNVEILPQKIENIIREDIGRWIPNVTVEKINVKFYHNEETKDVDIYKTYISITFTVNLVNKTETIELVIG